MQVSVEHESKGKKCCIAISECIFFVLALVVGIIYTAFFVMTNALQTAELNACTLGADAEEVQFCNMVLDGEPGMYYDWRYLPGFEGSDPWDTSNSTQTWTDVAQAQEYIITIVEDCGITLPTDLSDIDIGDIEIDADNDLGCLLQGSRWSVVYGLCGISVLIMAVNNLLLCGGAWSFHARGLGACCATLLCCVNFAAIIVTGVFRFNTWGSLAALSTLNSVYTGEITVNDYTEIQFSSDQASYENMAAFIIVMWVLQMIYCCTHCCFMGYVGKPPNAEETAGMAGQLAHY